LRDGDYRQKDFRYHLYAQWLAYQQVDSLSRKARRAGAGLYLDLPLGTHPYGFDVWREQETFVRDVNVGAPPDPIFTGGQDWGFHPLHPERSREQGHHYWIGSIRHQLGSAGLLRIDHVMGLHRLFWIPRGFDFKDGVYVRYPAHELYAVVCLESHRNRSIIVGENLGIVPKYVNRTMSRHSIQQMYLMQYSLRPDPERPMKPIPSGSVASLNTHDTPLFAAFWQDEDIEDRIDLGLLDEEGARREGIAREARKQAILTYLKKKGLLRKRIKLSSLLGACLSRLCRSRAGIVLVNLEDLWLETKPQNVPGSGERRSNWTRRLRLSLEELSQRDSVNDTLQRVESSFSQGRDRRDR
jgi:4-alpha-glucanotransferase